MTNIGQFIKGQSISGLLAAAVGFLLPARCSHCGKALSGHGFLCITCWGELSPVAPPYCPGCALPYEFSIPGEVYCAACLKDPPAFDWARAAVSYDGLGRSLVLKLKHGRTATVVPVMAQLMASAVQGIDATLLIPVPLHRWRFIRRRFNQSQLLAKDLSMRLGVPLDAFALVRQRATPSQGRLDRRKRYKNVKGAFTVPPHMVGRIKGQHIMLVDDVLTTGATASTCAKALKKAGAATVGVVAFARVGRPAEHG